MSRNYTVIRAVRATKGAKNRVIIRSKKGEELFNLLEDFVPVEVDRKEIVKVASLKKERIRWGEELPTVLKQ